MTAPVDSSALASIRDAVEAYPGRGHHSTSPFMTVVVRTQGQRTAPLRDALVCLAGQTDDDFDVIIVVHNPNGTMLHDLEVLVKEEVPTLVARVQFREATGGTVARPVNVALDHFAGSYVCFLDDDDVVFAQWIERFHEAATKSPGRIVRSVIADQPCQWEVSNASRNLVSAGPIVQSYPTTYSLLDHLVGGATPFHGLAFPREAFVELALRCDETLVVHEDWDLQLRAMRLLGVVSCDEVTGLYRQHDIDGTLSKVTRKSRDEMFAEMVREHTAGRVFLVDGDDLWGWRTNLKVVEEIWHQKQAVDREMQLLKSQFARYTWIPALVRRLPQPVQDLILRFVRARRATRSARRERSASRSVLESGKWTTPQT